MSATDIAAVNRAFEDAVRKGDADRIAQLYTADGMALPPDGPFVRGREAIRGLWDGVMRDMGLRDVKLQTTELEISGDTACTDHEIAKRVRDLASLNPPGGALVDDITYSAPDGPSVFTHPLCVNTWRNGQKIGDEPPAAGY